jgi:hypothetical protein
MNRLAFAFVVVTLSVSCGRQEQEATPTEKERNTAKAAAIAALAARNGADAEWQAPFKVSDRFGVYTYEIQRALIRLNAQPVILVGSVDDVISLGDGQYEVRGRQTLPSGPTIYFSLKCNEGRLQAVLARPPGLLDFFDDFGIAATIARVSKPLFKASAEQDSSDDVPAPQITIESGDVVVATGTCSEVIRLGGELPPNK